MKYILVVWLLLLSACLHAQTESKPIRVVWASQHCGPSDGAQLIRTESQWQQSLPRQAPPDLDWQKEQVLLVRMGVQANPGYSLVFEDETSLEEGMLSIILKWQQPTPDGIYPQMLVEPCLAIAIPKTGFRTVSVIDQTGKTRYRLINSD